MDTKTGKLTASDVTLLKRSGGMFDFAFSEDENCDVPVYVGQRIGPSAPHGPNKKESKLLRKLCSESGRTPEQVREVPKYRWMLAKAAGPKYPSWSSRAKKDPYKDLTVFDRDRHEFADRLKITVKHPKFNMLYQRELNRRKEEQKRQDEQAIINKLSQPW